MIILIQFWYFSAASKATKSIFEMENVQCALLREKQVYKNKIATKILKLMSYASKLMEWNYF